MRKLSTFQVVPLSSVDPDGIDTADEPRLSYPDALKTAQELKSQGKAFRVFCDSDISSEQRQAFSRLGAVS
jgi:hypothetical protein